LSFRELTTQRNLQFIEKEFTAEGMSEDGAGRDKEDFSMWDL
jgi:hypothetical protein